MRIQASQLCLIKTNGKSIFFEEKYLTGQIRNTYKHGNSNLFRRLDKNSIVDQYATSLVIRTTGVCCNQVVCKGMAGNKGILLVIVFA